MNSQELKAEIAKVEAEMKSIVETANAKYNILQGMKNAYQKVISSVENMEKSLVADFKKDASIDTSKVEAEVKTEIDTKLG